MRIGTGYDLHRLSRRRPLVLGGVTIPFEKGLVGHSDADVLVHAICDALLGAAGQGDIGRHFPDTDPEFEGIYSIRLLEKTVTIIQAAGWAVLNIDCTVFAQAPRLAPYIPEMEACIALAGQMAEERVNVKATTTEGLGTIGNGEAMAAMCVALLETGPA